LKDDRVRKGKSYISGAGRPPTAQKGRGPHEVTGSGTRPSRPRVPKPVHEDEKKGQPGVQMFNVGEFFGEGPPEMRD